MPWTTPFLTMVGNRAFRTTAGTWPTAVTSGYSGLWLALYKTSPTLPGLDGTPFTTADFTEYQRKEISIGAISGRTYSNDVAVSITSSATVSGSPATANYAAVFTAQTGGAMWLYGALTSPLLIGNGTPVVFPAGQIIFDELGTA